jgi:phosphoglycolate phosphatase-like HAD superfamily hydrolase
VLVGDSLTDIEAASAATVQSIAYANKPGKAEDFKRKDPDIIVTTLSSLLFYADS